jgi:two-component system, sensor histidine kinase
LNFQGTSDFSRFLPQVDLERRVIFLEAAKRSPFPAMLMICFLAYHLAPSVGIFAVSIWAGLTCSIFIVRLLGVSWVLKQAGDYANKPSVSLLMSGTGLLAGGSALYAILAWFPVLNDTQRAVMTMLYVGWVAGGMAAQGCYPQWTPYWTVPIFLGCVLAWGWRGDTFSWGMVFLLFLVFGLMAGGLISSAKSIKESIQAKLENRELAQEVLAQKVLIENAARAKTSFLIAASHDLRQPAMGMGLLISAIQDAQDLPTVKKIAEGAERALGAMERILQSLLEFSRLDSGQVKVTQSSFELRELLQALVDETQSSLQPGVQISLEASKIKVLSDPDLIEQIVRNFLSNAARFTEKGAIIIKARLIEQAVIISVSDTGMGIAENAQKSIFQEYFQIGQTRGSRSKGLGLGLSIVDKAAKLLKAQIQVESQLLVGSTFSINIPVEFPATTALDDTVRPSISLLSNQRLSGKTVLIVDDDLLVRESFKTVLEAYGAQVIACANPDTTFQLLKNAAGKVDAAFVDYQISEAYHGIDLIEAIRAQWPKIQCLLITGDVRKEVNERASEALIRVVHKPLRVQKIIEVLENKS